LADALFSRTQQRVLGILFGQPGRSFYASEIIGLAAGGSGAVQRELARLAQSGLVSVTRVGNQKHYRSNPASPLFEELQGIARKTFAVAEPLREALQSVWHKIDAAFVFGSIAKKSDTSGSDIDLFIVGNGLTYGEVLLALGEVRGKLGREINPTLASRVELNRKISERNSFFVRVLEEPKIWLKGSIDDLRPPRAVRARQAAARRSS
jgi:predicted nucleotidyltransferase